MAHQELQIFYSNQTLYATEFVVPLCSSFPINLIKTVRLRVKELLALLKLFRFLGVPVLASTRAFLDSHTKSNDQKMKESFLNYEHSTFRKSGSVAYGWKRKMSKKGTSNITNICKPVLKMFNMLSIIQSCLFSLQVHQVNE